MLHKEDSWHSYYADPLQWQPSDHFLMKQFCNKEDKFYSIFSLGSKLNYVLWLVDMFDSDQRKNLIDYSRNIPISLSSNGSVFLRNFLK